MKYNVIQISRVGSSPRYAVRKKTLFIFNRWFDFSDAKWRGASIFRNYQSDCTTSELDRAKAIKDHYHGGFHKPRIVG